MTNIRTAGRSGFIRRGGVRRRETVWLFGTAFNQTLAATTTAALVLSLNAAALALRPFTVIRTRGILHISSDQSGASQDFGASYGEAIVSDQASAIGVTAVPTPTVDNGSDLWFVYEFLMGRFTFGSAASFIENTISRVVDSKAMRKVEDGQDLVAVVEGPGAGLTADGSIIRGFTRTLIKLH